MTWRAYDGPPSHPTTRGYPGPCTAWSPCPCCRCCQLRAVAGPGLLTWPAARAGCQLGRPHRGWAARGPLGACGWQTRQAAVTARAGHALAGGGGIAGGDGGGGEPAAAAAPYPAAAPCAALAAACHAGARQRMRWPHRPAALSSAWARARRGGWPRRVRAPAARAWASCCAGPAAGCAGWGVAGAGGGAGARGSRQGVAAAAVAAGGAGAAGACSQSAARWPRPWRPP
mmetsp:Transcript_29360/g.74832  ORF Transcript_29360/g.74832 Transcript_29360/m.74832 type:complete len:229 (-) Transcript_29360:489-1175(-)